MDSKRRPPVEPVQIGSNDPLAGLHRWIADAQVDEAARARSQQRWLERAASEEASLAGALLDLAERRQPVAISTVAGRQITGSVVAVGADFCAVREVRLGDALLPSSQIAVIRPAPGDELPAGTRAAHFEIRFGHALLELAAERPDVIVRTARGEIRGELCSVGTDLITLVLDGDRRDKVHVTIGAVDHLIVLRR